jgi:hypothetical protein
MGSISLTEGQDYDLVLEFYEGGQGAQIKLMWTAPACGQCFPVKETIPASQLFPTSTDSVIYLHGDHLGSVSAASDSTGTRISQQEYDPWGKLRPDPPLKWYVYCMMEEHDCQFWARLVLN